MPFKNSKRTINQHKRKLTMLGSVFALLILTNCSKMTLSSDGECHLFEPIYDSVQDTKETRMQIRVHNDIGMSVCGWKPKK